jgi:hypothetical protein
MGVDTPDREALLTQFKAAYAEFRDQASQRHGWGFWTGSGRRLIGPFNAAGVARLYRLLLTLAFVAGVSLTLVGGTVGQLGAALVIGSIFAFGSWMAQAWVLSREAESKVEDDLLFAMERARLAPYADRILELERQLRALPPEQPDQGRAGVRCIDRCSGPAGLSGEVLERPASSPATAVGVRRVPVPA